MNTYDKRYTSCTIQWCDDGDIYDVVISALNDDYENPDINDDQIFFYGMSRSDLEKACENGDVIENEWKVLKVGESFDNFYAY